MFNRLDNLLLDIADKKKPVGAIANVALSVVEQAEAYAFLGAGFSSSDLAGIAAVNSELGWWLQDVFRPVDSQSWRKDQLLFRVNSSFTTTQLDDCADSAVLNAGKILSGASIPSKAALRAKGILNELFGNVADHSGRLDTLRMFLEVGADGFRFGVADLGKGALQGYIDGGSTDVASERAALQRAVVEHRSSTRCENRGAGFREIVDSLRSLGGSVRVLSGNAGIESVVDAVDGWRWNLSEKVKLTGFVVAAFIPR